MLSRRGLITGLISLAAAPAIVRASSLMPVKAMILTNEWDFGGIASYDMSPEIEALLKRRINTAYEVMRKYLAERINDDIFNRGIGGSGSFGELFDGR